MGLIEAMEEAAAAKGYRRLSADELAAHKTRVKQEEAEYHEQMQREFWQNQDEAVKGMWALGVHGFAAYAYSPRQGAINMGRDHFYVDTEFTIGRIHRTEGQPLCGRSKWGLDGRSGRSITCTGCLAVMARIKALNPPKAETAKVLCGACGNYVEAATAIKTGEIMGFAQYICHTCDGYLQQAAAKMKGEQQ